MSHSASHRRRKGSAYLPPPPPPPMSSPHPSPSPDSKQSRGFWSNFRFATRRSSGNHSDRSASGGDTLLPTTFKMASPLGGRNHRKTFPGSNSSKSSSSSISATNFCSSMNNSFLMGGVDKRRYRRKPKGLIYRIFWSSLPRRLCVSFFLLYLAVYHFLVPVGEWILAEVVWHGDSAYVGAKTTSDQAILSSLVHGPRFDQLPTIQQERKYVKQLKSERDALQEHGSGRHALLGRWKLLEQVVPEWFHRFDSDIVYKNNHNKNNPQQQQSKEKPKKEHPSSSEDQEQDDGADTDDAVDAAAVGGKEEQSPETNQETIKEKEKVHTEQKDAQEKKETATTTKTAITKKKKYHKPVSGSDHSSRHLTVKGGIYIANDDTPPSGDIAATESQPEEILLPLRTLHNMQDLGTEYSSCGAAEPSAKTPIGTTLVVQTSMDRLWILQETCARWTKDPIVVVVFVPHHSLSKDNDDETTSKQTELQDQTTQLLQNCPNLILVRYEADHIESLQGRYPVNRLRNVGLDLVQTSHVLMMDVDFVPSRDLERLVGEALNNTATATIDNNTNQSLHKAIVVPAFEKKAPKSCEDSTDPAKCLAKFLQEDGAFLPRNFEELKECYNDKECVVFQSEYNWDGHSTTMSDRWMKRQWYQEHDNEQNDNAKHFKTIPCFHTARYEPYVVIEWCPVANTNNNSNDSSAPISPYYDERFYGYGKNKIELVSHLRRSNVRFEILPEGFLVHNPHPESATKETWLNKDQTSDLHATMDALYSQFLAELDVKYKSVHKDSTKLCERTKPQ